MSNINQPLFDVKATSKSNVRTTTCASSRNVLTKASDEVTIKSYFEGVHELLKSKGSDAFCVDLDEVWPLVYERKDHAVRALTKDYFEGVDYTTQVSDNQTLRRNVEQDSKGSWGGSNKVTYYLTVSCLEHLVARKERRVFEVYRQVFHQAMDNVLSPSCMIEDKVARVKAWLAEEEAHRAELAMKEEQVLQLTDAHTQTLKNNNELVEFITSMFENRSLIAISLVAANYGMGAHDFNLLLHDLGVQHKCSGTWVLNKKYVGHNYTQSLCVGKPWTGWTREGVTFLYTLLKKNGIVPLRERK